MDTKRFPAKPISVYAVEQLPEERGEIEYAIPVIVLEVPITGVADRVLGFVVSTTAGDWYSYAYDQSTGEWLDVSAHDRTSDGEPAGSYQLAASVIADYWKENASRDDDGWPNCDSEAVEADTEVSGVRAENS